MGGIHKVADWYEIKFILTFRVWTEINFSIFLKSMIFNQMLIVICGCKKCRFSSAFFRIETGWNVYKSELIHNTVSY
ncbi:hypothetical protein CDG61_02200 [Acinetobacter sp. WCHAc010052]|nr:hypothetical protein CDG61_02200 [Acinetobacter sp. WCHAc010052]